MTAGNFPDWVKALPWRTIEVCCNEFGVDDPNVIAAIIQTESGGVSWRPRFEATWCPAEDQFRVLTEKKYLHEPERWAKRLGISLATEVMLQFTSHGLMQVMGFTARGIGYEDHLTEMAEPGIGVYWGTKYFASRLKKYKTLKAAISAYNAGSVRLKPGTMEFVNQVYVDKVLARLTELT